MYIGKNKIVLPKYNNNFSTKMKMVFEEIDLIKVSSKYYKGLIEKLCSAKIRCLQKYENKKICFHEKSLFRENSFFEKIRLLIIKFDLRFHRNTINYVRRK